MRIVVAPYAPSAVRSPHFALSVIFLSLLISTLRRFTILRPDLSIPSATVVIVRNCDSPAKQCEWTWTRLGRTTRQSFFQQKLPQHFGKRTVPIPLPLGVLQTFRGSTDPYKPRPFGIWNHYALH